MFEALGMQAIDGNKGETIVKDGQTLFNLGYRLQWKLLARIYHLRVTMEVVSNVREQPGPYRLDLRTRGVANVVRDFEVSGAETRAGFEMSDRLISSGVVEELASAMDLENLSITWSPETKIWKVALEPYPGSYVYTVFPPMAYAVRLKKSEVMAIRTFMVRLIDILLDKGFTEDDMALDS